jgi:hypothetical protein
MSQKYNLPYVGLLSKIGTIGKTPRAGFRKYHDAVSLS